MTGPTSIDVEDYGALLVLTELMTYGFLLPSIREKGGAYGAGCGVSESGIISFYSYRDPQCEQTYENFERGIADVIDGKFTQ
jgi:Zn-dependent M16 (insulinase) family peptidase